MSKINQIQNNLKEIDGGAFQKLCDCYLKQKGYHNLNPLGSVFGANKVRKGTPDTVVRQEDGRLIFAEYTTEQNKLTDKLRSDLRNCMDESKTGVPISDISEVIFCHTSRLAAEEENELYKVGKKNGVKVHIHGMESISFDLYQHYPGLVKDFLGLSIDSGQILPPDEFVESYDKNQYSTPLDTEFHFREVEIKKALETLNSSNLLLISGPAGVGKSRLTLEVIRQFEDTHTDYKIFCVRDRGQDLFEDLKVYFSAPGSFLIFIDDANRIGKFDYVVDMLQDQPQDQRIKVIATVRDYALDKVRNVSYPLGDVPVISIKAFEKAQIKELVKKLYDISNDLWLERIAAIANGNPRLAIMASKIAVEDGNLNSIGDVSSLYDHYFSSIRKDLEELEDESILRVAGIISLFRNVDKSNEQLMSTIHSVFEIDAETFWNSAKRLHDYELVDMYENVVVKITDQVLATYLFYLCVFRNEALSLKVILDQLFPSQINRIRDAIYPCLSSFNFDQLARQIRPVVSALWATHKETGKERDLRQLIEIFWFVLQTDALSYIHDCIDGMEAEQIELDSIDWQESNNFPDSNSLLSLLAVFNQAEDKDFQMALEMIFCYMEKRPQIVPDVLRLFSESFGFNRRSHLNGYSRQHSIVDALISMTQQGTHLMYSKLFLAVCKKYLYTRFDETESNKRSFTIHRFKLLSVASIFELREKIWEHIFEIYKNPDLESDVIDLLRHYSGSGFYIDDKEIAEKDSEKLIPFISSTLIPNNFSHCMMVQKYIKFTDRLQLESQKELIENFSSASYKIYKLLSYDYSERPKGVEIREYNQFKREQIARYTDNYDLKDYKDILHYCIEICKEITESHETHRIILGLCQLFITIADKDQELYAMVIKHYLSIGEPFKLHCNVLLVEKLILANDPDKSLALIESEDYPTKRHWQFAFQQALPSEQIKSKDLNRLYDLYEESELSEVPYDFDYLLKYQNQESTVVVKVIEILLKKSLEDEKFGGSYDDMFNPGSEVSKKLISIFKGKEDVLEKAYLAHAKVDKHADYDGKILNLIMNGDPNFLIECIDKMYGDNDYISRYDDSRDYSFLWHREDVSIVMTSAIEKILQYEKKRGYIRGGYLECYFCIAKNKVVSPDIIAKQDEFLVSLIENKAHDVDMMALIFDTIAQFENDRRSKLIALFLKKNDSFEDFKKLPLEPNSWSCSGSAVPVIDGRIRFLESLLPFCNSLDLLKHKKYIESNIQGLQEYIATEKKSDFMDD